MPSPTARTSFSSFFTQNQSAPAPYSIFAKQALKIYAAIAKHTNPHLSLENLTQQLSATILASQNQLPRNIQTGHGGIPLDLTFTADDVKTLPDEARAEDLENPDRMSNSTDGPTLENIHYSLVELINNADEIIKIAAGSEFESNSFFDKIEDIFAAIASINIPSSEQPEHQKKDHLALAFLISTTSKIGNTAWMAAKSTNNDTLAHVFAENGWLDCLKFLQRYQISLVEENVFGEKPIKFAETHDQQETKGFLAELPNH